MHASQYRYHAASTMASKFMSSMLIKQIDRCVYLNQRDTPTCTKCKRKRAYRCLVWLCKSLYVSSLLKVLIQQAYWTRRQACWVNKCWETGYRVLSKIKRHWKIDIWQLACLWRRICEIPVSHWDPICDTSRTSIDSWRGWEKAKQKQVIGSTS